MVSALNNEETRLIGMKPVNAIKQTLVKQGFSQPTSKEYKEKLLEVGTKVLDIFMNPVSWRDKFIKVKEGNDLLTPYGR